MPYDNSESKTKRSRSRRALNLVVAGAVAVAPVAGCDSASNPVSDAAPRMDATDAGADMVAAIDTGAAVDAEDDASLDVYPDGVRG